MSETSKFTIDVNGKHYVATVIMNFSLYGDYYCIYGVENHNHDYDVHCGKIIGNTVTVIEDEKEKSLTNKIILALTNAVKGMENKNG